MDTEAMGMVAVGLAVVVGLPVGIWLWSRLRLYRAIFASGRLRELQAALPALRAQALVFRGAGDPPHALLGEGLLALVYTMHTEPTGVWVHHLSLSVRGGYTAHAVGRTFLLAASRLLQWPTARVRFLRGESSVFHVQAHLSAEEHEAAMAAPVLPLADDVAALRLQQECLQAAPQLAVADAASAASAVGQ